MIAGRFVIVLLGLAQAPSAVHAMDELPFAAKPVPDAILAEQRGGFRLPSGIEVALAIDMLTAVDGAIILQTVTKIDSGSPTTSVYVPEQGQTVPLATRTDSKHASGPPSVTYDQQHGLQVWSRGASTPVHVSSGTDKGAGNVAAGLQQIDAAAALNVAGGVVRELDAEGWQGVEFQAPDLRILHLTGNAFGSVVVNSGSDRAIDTQTTLSVDLRGAGPDVLGSAMLRAEGLGIEALGSRF